MTRSIESMRMRRRSAEKEKFEAAVKLLGPIRVYFKKHGGDRKGGNWYLDNKLVSRATIIAEAERLGRKNELNQT